MLKAFRNLWKTSPRVRFYVRTGVVAAGGYVVQTYRSGTPLAWSALGVGAATAAFTAVVGLVTPVEPFVGINKTKVDVPSPPAVAARRR